MTSQIRVAVGSTRPGRLLARRGLRAVGCDPLDQAGGLYGAGRSLYAGGDSTQTRAEVAVGEVTYPGAGSPFVPLLVEIGVAGLVAAELWQRRVAAADPVLVDT